MSGIEPGSLPKPVSRAERRKLDEADRKDADRQEYARPNVDPDAPSKWTRCPQSKYQEHRIVGGRGPAALRILLEAVARLPRETVTHRDDAISEADFYDDAPDGDDEPRCIECGCGLFTDEHAFDCSVGEEEENDGEED